MQNSKGITRDHIKSVNAMIADKVGITHEQAEAVLNLLHVDKLMEQSNALLSIIEDPIAVQALGYSKSNVAEIQQQLTQGVTLENLRVGIKSPGMLGAIMV